MDARERPSGPPALAPQQPARPPHEPAIRAPWPAVVLPLAWIALYALQARAVDQEALYRNFGFSPSDLAQGRWRGLVTSLFMHGGWPHVLLNAVGGLAFGAPVARLLGRGVGPAAGFFGFFIVCGVLSGLGFAGLHPGADSVLVGASGGVAGLMGAGSRLVERRPGLAPFTSSTVIGMAVAWVVVNLIVGLVGLGAVSGGAPIAWEAHLAGYAAGLLLIGPLAAMFRKAEGT